MRESSARGALRVLGQRNFGPYFWGNLLSNCGMWFQAIAQSILVYRLTGSAFLLGVVQFSQFVGTFLLAPVSGSAADRFDRRRLLVVTQLGATALSAGLAAMAWAGLATAPVVIAFALVTGLLTAFAIPAMQSIVPALVVRDDLGTAVALNAVTFHAARAIGPAAGAIVVDALGIPAAIALNALSYLALVGALAWIRPVGPTRAPASATKPRLRDSVRLVAADARLAGLLMVVAVVSLAGDPVTTLAPAFATRVYHRPDTLAGYLIGVFGLGSVTAAFMVAGRRLGPRFMALTMTVLGVGMLTFAMSPWLTLGLAGLYVGGVGFLSSVTAATTVLQLDVDESQRGRLMALWSVAFLGVRPFGSLADGALAEAYGVQLSTAVMASLALGGAVAMLALVRRRSPEAEPV